MAKLALLKGFEIHNETLFSVARVNAFDFDVSPRLDDVTEYARVTSSELSPLSLNKFQNPFKNCLVEVPSKDLETRVSVITEGIFSLAGQKHD